MQPSIVLFDLGNVVARWEPAPRIADYARRSGLSPAEVLERLSADGFWADSDRGRFTSAQMERGICKRLGCAFSGAELLRLQSVAFEVQPAVLALARETAAQARVGILTNNPPLLHDALPHHFPELLEVFDPVLFSFQLGHVKPELALFETVRARLAVPAGEIVFIDDDRANVDAADSVGWDALLYQSPDQLRSALAGRGLIDGA